MYYKVHTLVIAVSIHQSMGRHFTLTGTICTSAECPGGHSALVQIVRGDSLHSVRQGHTVLGLRLPVTMLHRILIHLGFRNKV